MKTPAALLFVASILVASLQAGVDGPKVEQITGLKGTLNEAEKVFKVSSPRTDVKVSVDGWEMPPFMGLTSWAAFTDGKASEAMVMGDVVLLQDEVNPAMSAALDAGLEVTALHNHFFFDEPKVFFMHIGGEGDTAKLATGVKAVLDAQKAVRSNAPQPAKSFGKPVANMSNITLAPLETALGGKGQAKDGMVKFVIGRSAKMPCGCTVGKEMGVNTWAAFAGTDDDAVVDGDFCVLPTELQGVLKTLRKSGINIVAIHQHMAMDDPHYIFLHYWGRGPALTLGQGVKAALATTASK